MSDEDKRQHEFHENLLNGKDDTNQVPKVHNIEEAQTVTIMKDDAPKNDMDRFKG